MELVTDTETSGHKS